MVAGDRYASQAAFGRKTGHDCRIIRRIINNPPGRLATTARQAASMWRTSVLENKHVKQDDHEDRNAHGPQCDTF